MREEIAFLAGTRDWGVTRESWLSRVPGKVQTVTYRTVKALWYGEIKDENHWAARDIRRAVQIIRAQQEARKRAAEYEALAHGLDVIDAPFHEQSVATFLGVARKLRGENST
jgi:hypothetical protein